MAEPSLAAAYKDLRGGVGHFLGYGRGADLGDTTWTSNQEADVDQCLKGGLRYVYHCGYDWTFLKPFRSLTLASGATVLPLPDDAGGVEGKGVLSTTTDAAWYPVPFIGQGRIYALSAQEPTATGRPMMCCFEPAQAPSGSQGQRFQLRFYPLADQEYTIQVQIYLNPDYLSGAFPYVYGGAQHAQLFLTAAKAVAEIDLDNMLPEQSPQFREYQRLLQISKSLDRRAREQLVGYNGDRSDRLEWWDYGVDNRRRTGVTFDGVTY